MTSAGPSAEFALTVPVALICFNRPAETARVMETLRKARPPRLYVIADAPRPHVAGEAERCARVRAVATTVDWNCEVVPCFADTNMGCRDRIISGLSMVFTHEERAIILEDDCIAHPDFFRFSQELLARYVGDSRVFAISGDNFQDDSARTQESYYFSRLFHCWGWATWRDRWQSIDFSMSQWPARRNTRWLTGMIGVVGAEQYRFAFDQTYERRNSSWAYRAGFASLTGDHVNILPAVNLVSNIGVGETATHTVSQTGFEGRAIHALGFPLRHPARVAVNEAADRYTFNLMSGTWRRRIKLRLKFLLRALRSAA